MQGSGPNHKANADDSEREVLLDDCVLDLEIDLEEAGVLALFERPTMISMQLPDRSHPVACTFFPGTGGPGGITLDLQIGGLSSRAFAVLGRTTMAEADIVGTTLTLTPPPDFEEFEKDECCAICAAESFHPDDGWVQTKWRTESMGRHPGKAPHQPDAEELQTLAFAFHGILTAFNASELSPTDLSRRDEGILEIRVEGSIDALIAGKDLDVSWERVPFEPIRMAPFPAARLDRELRRRPLRKKRTWILHLRPTCVSMMDTRDTIQMLLVMDAGAGDILHHEPCLNGTADSIGRAMEKLLREIGYRPGSAITTSPRLDEILGDGLESLGIHYVKGRRLKASDPRIRAVEHFMQEAESTVLAQMAADPNIPFQDPTK
ncbi:hypothetical protein Poly30_42740 [Planctomycetes bacterium Poly30]|uniref:Uncharacterized protein n=1 Tax=Saltatorellus ferox TaxID=2528018 RepID=A0A518EXC7_9BACT|nr:hypothetical protein Poly30_42740 [Planctomycetes bacterium Poly30]